MSDEALGQRRRATDHHLDLMLGEDVAQICQEAKAEVRWPTLGGRPERSSAQHPQNRLQLIAVESTALPANLHGLHQLQYWPPAIRHWQLEGAIHEDLANSLDPLVLADRRRNMAWRRSARSRSTSGVLRQ